jgi:hypothetical protein
MHGWAKGPTKQEKKGREEKRTNEMRKEEGRA